MAMANGSRSDGDDGPKEGPLRVEAQARAHDRLSPEVMLDAIAAVDLYVDAFVAGARFATGGPR